MSKHQPYDTADDGLVRSLTHALLILEWLASEPEPLSLHELTALVKMPKSTVHRLLSTLRARQFVARDIATGRYTVGPMAWVVGSRSPLIARLREAARQPLGHLRKATGEAVFVTVLNQSTSLLVDFVSGLRAITVARYDRAWAPALTTAAGRVALAYRSSELTGGRIGDDAAASSHEARKPAQLAEQLNEIRARGWEVERTGETTLEVAAPVRDHSAIVVGAAGVVTPLRQGDQPSQSLLAAVTAAADQISSRLGYLPRPTWVPSLP